MPECFEYFYFDQALASGLYRPIISLCIVQVTCYTVKSVISENFLRN